MYDENLIAPMRRELTDLGLAEARSASSVDQFLSANKTTLVVINSICGCAAANARPAVRQALKNAKKPEQSFTVFAGNDVEAVKRVRDQLHGFPPSSPNIVLMKGQEVLFNLERHQIEGRSANAISADLVEAFNEHC